MFILTLEVLRLSYDISKRNTYVLLNIFFKRWCFFSVVIRKKIIRIPYNARSIGYQRDQFLVARITGTRVMKKAEMLDVL